MRFGFRSPFTILLSEFLGGEIAAVTAVAAEEEKRRIVEVLKAPRRTRDKDDIVLKVFSGEGFYYDF